MSIFFHGTSLQNANNILKEGFNPKFRNWTTSTAPLYCYKYDDHIFSMQKALWQSGIPVFREENICKRAVLAIDVNDEIIEQDTDSNSPGNYQLKKSYLSKDSVVGFWHDKYNLMPLRWLFIFKFLQQSDIVNLPIDEDILPLKDFFNSIESFPYKVPLVEKFNYTKLDFNVNQRLFNI